MSETTTVQRNDERLFFYVVIVMTLVIAAAFCGLMFFLNNREKESSIESELIEAAKHSEARLVPTDHPRRLVDFSLTDRTGRNVTRAELNGKILVVNFLLTSCSLTCPAVTGCMEQIQNLTTNQPDVKLLSLTVSPRDDTVEVLAEYSRRFNADTNRWFFLTGDKTTLYNLIGNSFLAQDVDNSFGYMPGNFAHTERIALVDAQGNLRGYFDGLNPNASTAVVDEINRLRK
jgi:cytochrome oxidase Cu insertion factor (SCO1/SenC/PrrC family)